VRFLLDSNLSPRVAALLRAGGLDAEHVRDHGLQAEPEEVILAFARERGFVVVSGDTGLGELLSRERSAAVQPSEH
jgi:predicted nuclease of predicted toxin-antitoxin system